MVRIIAGAPATDDNFRIGPARPPQQDDGSASLTRTQAGSLTIEGAAADRIERFQRSKSSNDKCGKMIDSHHEHGIRGVALDELRALLQRDEAGDAGD